jgi:ATP-dependent Clp protease, protease subunit
MDVFKQNMLINEMKISSALRQRKVHLSDEVYRDSIFEVEYLIDKLVKIDQMSGTKEPINLVINSFGGEIYAGLTLISKIEELQDDGYEINTIISGCAMSMGSAISIIGTNRKAYRYSTIMIHQPSSSTFGCLKDQQEDIRETERMWELMKKIIKENSNITEEQLENIYQHKKDWYMNAEEALELGVIDEIM